MDHRFAVGPLTGGGRAAETGGGMLAVAAADGPPDGRIKRERRSSGVGNGSVNGVGACIDGVDLTKGRAMMCAGGAGCASGIGVCACAGDPSQGASQPSASPWVAMSNGGATAMADAGHSHQTDRAADQQAMEQHFTLAFTPGPQAWQLQLTPKQPPLNQVFAQLEMQGSLELQQLLIRDRQGDETQLNFSAIQHVPEELTDVEQRRFAD